MFGRSSANSCRVSFPEWSASLEFRATGPEHGGGNIQIWYTNEGRDEIGFENVFTVGKFDGLVVLLDMHGGQVSKSGPRHSDRLRFS